MKETRNVRDSLPCAPSREHGGILLAAMIVTLLVTTVVIAAAYESGMRLRSRHDMGDGSLALIYAQAGIENAARLTDGSDTWRADLPTPTWIDGKSLDEGTFTVNATDPEDGDVLVKGVSASSSVDTLRLTSTASIGGLTRSLATDFVPFPHAALRYVGYSNTTIDLQNVDIEGQLRANGDVLDQGGALLAGNITTIDGATVSASLQDLNTTVFYVPGKEFMPVVDYSWFKAAGKQISLPVSHVIMNCVISDESNPFGAVSPLGLYWIEAGGDVVFWNVYISACIVITSASKVIVGDWSGNTTYFYHRSIDPDRYPALLTDGDLWMYIEDGGSATLKIDGEMTTVGCGLEGIFYTTKEFWGPQLNASSPIEVKGAFMAEKLHILGPGTHIEHHPGLHRNPIAQMNGEGLRPVPGSTREQ